MLDANSCRSAAAADRHADIMGRFEDLIGADPRRRYAMGEICAALGVKGRILRMCCNAHLGMGPRRYLQLRRMQLARRALRQADAGVTKVSDVARQHGFASLGRFAAAYRDQFGELPSVALRRTAEG
jgi:AraC-like DNA-binding protein